MMEGGRNIALKVPAHQHEATVAFYRDTLGLKPIEGHGEATGFQFGANQLWIDRMTTLSQSEIWLELVTEDTKQAATTLADAGIARCDAIEPLGESFDGFWIASPSNTIHLVNARKGAW